MDGIYGVWGQTDPRLLRQPTTRLPVCTSSPISAALKGDFCFQSSTERYGVEKAEWAMELGGGGGGRGLTERSAGERQTLLFYRASLLSHIHGGGERVFEVRPAPPQDGEAAYSCAFSTAERGAQHGNGQCVCVCVCTLAVVNGLLAAGELKENPSVVSPPPSVFETVLIRKLGVILMSSAF